MGKGDFYIMKKEFYWAIIGTSAPRGERVSISGSTVKFISESLLDTLRAMFKYRYFSNFYRIKRVPRVIIELLLKYDAETWADCYDEDFSNTFRQTFKHRLLVRYCDHLGNTGQLDLAKPQGGLGEGIYKQSWR